MHRCTVCNTILLLCCWNKSKLSLKLDIKRRSIRPWVQVNCCLRILKTSLCMQGVNWVSMVWLCCVTCWHFNFFLNMLIILDALWHNSITYHKNEQNITYFFFEGFFFLFWKTHIRNIHEGKKEENWKVSPLPFWNKP